MTIFLLTLAAVTGFDLWKNCGKEKRAVITYLIFGLAGAWGLASPISSTPHK